MDTGLPIIDETLNMTQNSSNLTNKMLWKGFCFRYSINGILAMKETSIELQRVKMYEGRRLNKSFLKSHSLWLTLYSFYITIFRYLAKDFSCLSKDSTSV